MVVGTSLYSQIREAYIAGESQRSIAKRLGVSRPTVKKYCEGAVMPGVRKEYLRVPSVVTAEVTEILLCSHDMLKKMIVQGKINDSFMLSAFTMLLVNA